MVGQPVDDTSAYVSGSKLFVVISCLFFGAFLIALDANIINIAIPQIATDFEALNSIAWYGTAYLLLITALQPIYGSLYKHFRNDIVYNISILTFEVGSILCAAALNSPMFIFGRAIAGLGGAGILQGGLSIISQVVPLEQRPLCMGIVVSVFALTSTVGPILGGVFTEKASWRWCFWMQVLYHCEDEAKLARANAFADSNVPVGVLVVAGLTFFLRVGGISTAARSLPIKDKISNMDPLGCIVFLGAVCCLLLSLQWGGQTKPWDSPDVLGCLVGGFVIGIFFFYLQWRRKDRALIPLRILGKRSIWTGVLVLFFFGAQTYLNVFFLPFWFQAVRGITPVQTGVHFIALLVPQILALVIMGGVVKHYGHYVPYMLVGQVIAIGGQAMLTQLQLDTCTIFWAVSFVMTGLGTGMAQQLPYTAVAVVLSDEDIPVGNALAVLFYQLGGAVAISMGQTVAISTLVHLIPRRLPGLPVDRVLASGATNLRSLASSASMLVILQDIWNTAIARTMLLSAVMLAMCVPFTMGMEWLNAVNVAKQRRQDGNAKNTQCSSNLGAIDKEVT